MHKVGKVLETVIARQPRSSALTEARLRLVFREVLGEDLAAGCEDIRVRRGTVSVVTPNPALAHQLRLDAEQLLNRLNEASRLPRQVRELRVQVGRSGNAAR